MSQGLTNVALAVLELPMPTCLPSKSQKPACLSLSSAWVRGMSHHTWFQEWCEMRSSNHDVVLTAINPPPCGFLNKICKMESESKFWHRCGKWFPCPRKWLLEGLPWSSGQTNTNAYRWAALTRLSDLSGGGMVEEYSESLMVEMGVDMIVFHLQRYELLKIQ